jgi:ABC-type nitrate/sulfonate/bicarbonate transport system permease component
MSIDRQPTRNRASPLARIAAFFKRRRTLLSVLSFLLLMLIWEIAGRGGNTFLTSHPTAIFRALVDQITSGQLPNAFMQSLQPLLLGYALAIVVGVPIGLMLGRYWAAEAGFGFYFIGLDATPLVAFLPLFILWFGLHLLVKVVIVFLFSMTPIVINTWMGVKSVPRTLVEVGKSFVGSEAFITRKIVLPYALPSIVTGLRLGMGRAVIAMAIAELFTALSGLGGLLLKRSEDYDTAGIFVPAFIFMAMGITAVGILGWIERRIAPWHKATSAGNE